MPSATWPRWRRWVASAGSGAQIGRFLRDPRLQRIFSFQALYAGVPPSRALAAYAVIAYMDTVAGVWFPRGECGRCPRHWPDRKHRRRRALQHDGDLPGASGERTRPCTPPRANVLAPMRWCSRPICRWCTACSAGHLDGWCHCRWSASAVVLHAGVRAGTGPGWTELAHHTISSARRGSAPSTRSSTGDSS